MSRTAKSPRSRRSSSLSAYHTSDLQREIAARQRSIKRLTKKRAALITKLESIDDQIARAGGSTQGRRQRNNMTLVQVLQKVLTGTTMGVTEVAHAVQKTGYRTNAEHFRTIVNQTVIKHKKVFRRVSRGKYTAVTTKGTFPRLAEATRAA